MSDGSTQGARDLEEMKAAPKTDIRLPTFADKKRIREAVEEHYDEAKGCWNGDLTDQRVGEMLKVPRAWVTQVRDIYGPDRNRSEDLKREAELAVARAKVGAAVELAEKAMKLANTIIDLSAQLETTLAELKIKKQEIGG